MELSKSNTFNESSDAPYSSQEFTYEEMKQIREGLGEPSNKTEQLYSPIISNYPLKEVDGVIEEEYGIDEEDLKSEEGEVIVSIDEIQDYIIKVSEDPERRSKSYSGYKLVTLKSEYLIVIEEGQECCEHSGYVMTEDDPKKFIGSIIFNITRTDDESITKDLIDELEAEDPNHEKQATTQFLNVNTSNGLFQLVVYNCHNGYYGHRIAVIKNNEIIYEDKI